MNGSAQCSIVPPYLLQQISTATGLSRASAAARQTLDAQQIARQNRIDDLERGPAAQRNADAAAPKRAVFDAHHTRELPGTLVRSEGEPPTSDPAVTEAYDGLGHTARLYAEVFGRSSIDGAGMPLHACVHYGRDYDNAFWNGAQMVFGDGDGEVFRRFTVSVSIIGHELTHGVTEHTAGLRYTGQSGALNESVSDVFGCLVEQYASGQDAASANWLVGAGLFTDAVQGRALRSLKAPGTAYDDDVLGHDPQPATMSGYVETDDDNGGVHINSGIPNHAFYLVATALGGHAWERAGRIWYDTLTNGSLGPETTFADFASATVASAAARYTDEIADVVDGAWRDVGVPGGAPQQVPHVGQSLPDAAVLIVERSGGVTGLPRSWRVTLGASDHADRLRALVASLPSQHLRSTAPTTPDRFSYRIRCAVSLTSADAVDVRLDESQLTREWSELIDLVRASDEA